MKLSRKTLIAGGLVIVLLSATAGFFVYRHFNSREVPPAPEGINLGPATKEEKTQSDNAKDAIVANQEAQQNSSNSSSKKTAAVLISSASASNVSSYVTGIFEDGGTCTATFTQAGTTVTRTSEGFKNVSYTQCAPISPNLPNAGQWSVVVSYSSSTAEGKSSPTSF
jgi:hypothetical protein